MSLDMKAKGPELGGHTRNPLSRCLSGRRRSRTVNLVGV